MTVTVTVTVTVAVTMIGMGGDVQRRGWRAEMGRRAEMGEDSEKSDGECDIRLVESGE